MAGVNIRPSLRPPEKRGAVAMERSDVRRTSPRARCLAGGLAAVVLAVAGCASCAPVDVHAAREPHTASVGSEWMPPAPATQTAWLRAVDRSFDDVGAGRSAEDWLRVRSIHRRPGEQLAVIVGIDDVMLQSHFSGLHTLVPRSVQFTRVAQRLGYAVFYVTGRSRTNGYDRVKAILERSKVPAAGYFGRPVGDTSVESGKAAVRELLAKHYTLVMSVAASEASFDGSAPAEKEIRLPAFVEAE